jgi:hypothetical protein
MTTSGAPLTVVKCCAFRIPRVSHSGRSWKVAMNLYSESNGTSARRGRLRRVSSASTPILAARTTSAASVGSPITDSSSPTVASLERASPSPRREKSGGSAPATPVIAPVFS